MRRRGFLSAVMVVALLCVAPAHAAKPVIKEYPVSLVEVRKENRSFGNGVALYAP